MSTQFDLINEDDTKVYINYTSNTLTFCILTKNGEWDCDWDWESEALSREQIVDMSVTMLMLALDFHYFWSEGEQSLMVDLLNKELSRRGCGYQLKL